MLPLAVILPTGMVLTQLALPLATTLNSTSHEPLPAMSAPVKLMLLAPAGAENAVLPAQVVEGLTGLARVMPAGRGSMNETLLMATAPLLFKRIRTVDVPPELTADGLNDLVAPSEELMVKDALADVGVMRRVEPSAKVSVALTAAVLL